MNKKIILIDGNFLMHRSVHAYSSDKFKADDNTPTNVIFGFLAILLSLLKKYKADCVAVAFDKNKNTFRKKDYAEYKNGRKPTPPVLLAQISTVKKMLDVLKIERYELDDYEADDIIATLAKRENNNNNKVYIYTSDKDSYQLINNNTVVLSPNVGASNINLIDLKKLYTEYKLTPDEYRIFAAIVGEDADNLVGVKGIGKSGATKLIEEYKTIDNIYAHLDELKQNTKNALIEYKENVLRNYKLNKLITNLDLPFDDLSIKPIEKQFFNEFFGPLKFNLLPNRIIKSNVFTFIDSMPKKTDKKEELTAKQKIKLKNIIFIYNTNDMATVLDGNNLTVINKDDKNKLAIDSVKNLLNDPSKPKVVFDLKLLLHLLKTNKYQNVFCLLLTAYLVDSSFKIKSFDQMEQNYGKQKAFNFNFNSISLENDQSVLNNKIAEYKQSTDQLKKIYLNLLDKINSSDEQDILYNLELPLVKILYDMESNGILIDKKKLDNVLDEISWKSNKAQMDAINIIGVDINLNSPKQLQTILFDKLKLLPTRKIKTGYSTDSKSLLQLFAKTKNEFVEKLLIYRESIKQKQIVISLQKSIKSDSKIHTTFTQNGTTTGRLASNNPNLQNIPIKTDIGRQIRSFFVSDKNNVLISADYSQIEMRVIAHMSEDEFLIDAFNSGQDLHKKMASMLYNIPFDNVTTKQRNNVKGLVYGLIYGLGTYSLANSLGISNYEAEILKEKYFNSFPKVKTLLDKIIESAHKNGYTKTIIGRKRFIFDINSESKKLALAAERMALNAPIQGSAADIIKYAMILLDNKFMENNLNAKMLLQIHDELIIDAPKQKLDKIIEITKNSMCNAFKLKVPLEISIGVGDSWDSAAH